MSHATRPLEQGNVRANGVDFHFLACGTGPLALCVHGFPDSAHTYRYLLPALADAGFRAVAPFLRGFAPTSVPNDARYDMKTIGDDFNALHGALGGDGEAVLISHDWGAVAAYAALIDQPQNWRRTVISNIPPMPVFGQVAFTYEQLKRFFYIWFFQMDCAEEVLKANDFAMLDGLWADWSPGYDASFDLAQTKACLRDPAHLDAALGYYRTVFNPRLHGTAAYGERQAQVWGQALTMPTLYFHGLRDGCVAITPELAKEIPACFGPGSRVELIPDAGHFLLVEKPDLVNPQIVEFLRAR
jgi:pimeloyl-ACP methyl ester carboxylesterase